MTEAVRASSTHPLDIYYWRVGVWVFAPTSMEDTDVRAYAERLWVHLDALVVLHPPVLEIVYEWRQESETTMGHTEVTASIDEYIPYYHTYLPALCANECVTHVFLDEHRRSFSDPERNHDVRSTDIVLNMPNTFSHEKKTQSHNGSRRCRTTTPCSTN